MHYLHGKSLHSLPKFVYKTQKIQVGNRQFVNVLFSIPITIDINCHRFKVYMLVSEIQENIDVVFGIKNIFELEGIINSHKSCFSSLNRSIPFLAKEQVILKSKEQKLITVEAPFMEEISGLAIINVLYQITMHKYNGAKTKTYTKFCNTRCDK